MKPFVKYSTVAIPPSAKKICGFKDISTKFVELSSQFILRWVETDSWMIIGSRHFDEVGLVGSEPNSLVSRKRSHNHRGNCIEDSALPILIIGPHFFRCFRLISIVLNGALFNTPEVLLTNSMVGFHKLSQYFSSECVKVIREFRNVHWRFSIEVNLSHNLSRFNLDYLFVNILGMLKHDILGLFEGINCGLTLFDVFVNRQRKPIVICNTLVHVLH